MIADFNTSYNGWKASDIDIHEFTKGYHLIYFGIYIASLFVIFIVGIPGVLSFACKKPTVKKRGSLSTHYGALAIACAAATIGMICLTAYLYIDLPEKLFTPSPLFPVMSGCFAIASIYICAVYIQCRKAVKNFRKVNNCEW